MAAAAVVDVIVTTIVIVILTVIIVTTVNSCSSGHPAHSLVAIMTELTQFELNSGLLIFCSCNQLVVMRHVEITDIEIKKTKYELQLHYVAQASCVVIEHG